MGQGYIFASKRFICMVTYIYSFLILFSKHSNVNNKVGFVAFSTPRFNRKSTLIFFSKSQAVFGI